MSEARIWLVGSSGSGKSTVGKSLGEFYQIPFIQLDSIYHQRNWQPLDSEEFRTRVQEIVASPGWIIDGNYRAVADVIKSRVTCVIFLDLPRRIIVYRILIRSISRIIRRSELWNGNRETIGSILSPRPGRNVLLYALINFTRRRRTYLNPEFLRSHPDASFVHLRNRKAIDRHLRFLTRGVSGEV